MAYLINTPLQTHTVYLDSVNCVSRSPNFTYRLATPIRSPVSLKILLSVENVTFRNTLPNVVDGKFSFIYDTLGLNGAPQTYTMPVPTGIYSMNSFKNLFNEYRRGQPVREVRRACDTIHAVVTLRTGRSSMLE